MLTPSQDGTCKVCGASFTKLRHMQSVCSLKCAKALPKIARKAEKEQLRQRKEKAKPRSKWLAEAQAAFNKYVRLRDKDLPCVSCGRPATWDGQWHASHFRSVGAASAVRFHLWNVHKACSICNNHKSGNLSEYEPRLREKIGGDKVDWLRTQNQRVRYSVEYLARLKAVFNRKANRLK